MKHHRSKHGKCGSHCGGGGMIAFLLNALFLKILWNLLVPELFGGPMIGYFQALGLILLSRMLFGGGRPWRHRGKRHRKFWKTRMKEKMAKMSPEERAKFKESFQSRGFRVNIWEIEEEDESDDTDQSAEGTDPPDESPEEDPPQKGKS